MYDSTMIGPVKAALYFQRRRYSAEIRGEANNG